MTGPLERWRSRIQLSAFCVAVMFAFGTTPTAQAQTYSESVLYSFTGAPDGVYPNAGLVLDSTGNLYGTTKFGGTGFGTVFEVSAAGPETVLHSFTGAPDGAFPRAGLVRDSAGNLYGTTYGGGLAPSDSGTVFKVDPAGIETVLYSFRGGGDGRSPKAGLIRDAAGNLYGTTSRGGAGGTIFKLDPSDTETVLYRFAGPPDGADSSAGLVRDAAGNLYGTAGGGASVACFGGCGMVFKLDTAGTETALYSFNGGEEGPDGAFPLGSLVMDSAGNVYGTTEIGGTHGAGTVFAVSPAGIETVLYNFTRGADGGVPVAGLVRDEAGNLYGTTSGGGAHGVGTVFKLSPSGAETVLYSFAGAPDGASPEAGLVRDKAGNFYGTTYHGGTGKCRHIGVGLGCGTVFRLSPK
jgi:uncharacterized repeat protein (TIGR03803 family)